MARYDAVVIGAGPNGLAAAIALARAGRRVLVLEARDKVGGGASSAQLTLPGFVHDLGSAVHPLAVGSPFFRSLPLADFGLTWIEPPVLMAHPFDDGSAAVLLRSVAGTAAALGRDGPAYQWLVAPVVRDWNRVAPAILGPLRPPRHPLAMASFGVRAFPPARLVAEVLFREQPARALWAGLAAHSCLPLERSGTNAVALVLAALGHTAGWPIPRGGAQNIADAMAAYLCSLGGKIVTGQPVSNLAELPRARAVICDLTPRQLVRLAGDRLPARYRSALERYRYGPGVFKMDWALARPIPWRAEACRQAGTVHVGGTMAEVAESERAPWRGRQSVRPYVLLSQPSLFDPTRAPEGKHTAWAYCHVPNGSGESMVEQIEAQLERFAPGFRACILARSAMGPAAMEAYNANLVGGDINGGAMTVRQLLTRPVVRWDPYATPVKGLYICSSSTPPGGGVHGMCGYHAAQSLLRRQQEEGRRKKG